MSYNATKLGLVCLVLFFELGLSLLYVCVYSTNSQRQHLVALRSYIASDATKQHLLAVEPGVMATCYVSVNVMLICPWTPGCFCPPQNLTLL